MEAMGFVTGLIRPTHDIGLGLTPAVSHVLCIDRAVIQPWIGYMFNTLQSSSM